MSNVIISNIPGFYIYWCRNTTWKSGDPSSDRHQPMNPMAEAQALTVPKEIYDLITPVSDHYPQIEVDKQLDPSTITLRSFFREPFLMLTLFSHKELPSVWTGTSDTITANFSDRANIDNNLAIQLRLPDPTGSGNHVDLLLDGGRIDGYRLVGEAQGAVMEEIDIKFAEVSENTQAMDCDDGFDDGSFDNTTLVIDGGWALWNSNQFASKIAVLLTMDVTITIGGVAISGLQVQSWTLTIDVPNAMEFVASSRTAGVIYEEVKGPWKLDVDGLLSGNNALAERFKPLSTKTKSSAKLSYGTSPLSKYFQFTNAVLDDIEGLGIPAAGNPIPVTYKYVGAGGSVLSYVWVGSETTDPSNHINHTDA